MKRICTLGFVALLLIPLATTVGAAQEGAKANQGLLPVAQGETRHGPGPDASSAGELGERTPLYQLQKSDTLEVSFTFAPEFNQTVSVQPDGYIALKGTGSRYAEGSTLPEFTAHVNEAYASLLRDPEVTVTLRDFEKPSFVAAGEVVHPGKYELRGTITLTQAVAMAGGFTMKAKPSQVLLFRRVSSEWAEARVLDVKKMLRAHQLSEDLYLRPGDMLYVPQSIFSKIRGFLPTSSLGMYMNPSQF
jgi:polysaccharide export outer membrane protein